MFAGTALSRATHGYRRARLAVRSVVAIATGVVLAALVDAGAPPLAIVAALAIAVVLATTSLWPRRTGNATQAVDTGDAAAAQSAAVAHDLRSPLVTVRSYLELLSGEALGPLPAAAQRAAERGARAAAQAQLLVEQTLERYAVSAATAPLAAAGEAVPAVDLSALLDDVVAAMQWEIDRCGAHIARGALPPVQGDRAALYRIFANLLQNAVRHGASPQVAAGTPAVRIFVGARVRGGRCEVEVRDHGPGIPAALRHSVFEPGERGALTSGAGLGLATVRRLVTEQGGRVWLDTTVTDGACIRLSLSTAAPRA